MKMMRREYFNRSRALALLPVLLFVLITVGRAQAEPEFKTAPLNPEFISWMQRKQVTAMSEGEVEGVLPGIIPSPHDFSYLKGMTSAFDSGDALPASYDLRTLGKLSAVRNQGSCGSCWTFATYASLESCLLPYETWDFSENNMKNTHGYDWAYCDGGNYDIATAYLARWSGAIQESDDPYNPSSGVSPTGLVPVKHIQNVTIVPPRSDWTANDTIKRAIMEHGAVGVNMQWDDSCYKSSTYAFYNSGSGYTNHAVAAVGWDDDFPASSFRTAPPGNGAFIIRNSWGTGWGQAGYFYVSYYDTFIGFYNYLFNEAQESDNYGRIYQHDPLGWVDKMGTGSSDTAYFANIFTAEAKSVLKAVSFYTASLDNAYEIRVYLSPNSGPLNTGGPALTMTGIVPEAGYHTVDLSAEVPLSAGQRFSVAVKLTTPGLNYPIPVERPMAGYSSQATASIGQSYVSTSWLSWSDLTASHPNWNVCLKAFADDVHDPEITTPATLPGGKMGEDYYCQLQVVDGTSPYTWSLIGSLPPGLSLNAAAGSISGRPTQAGDFDFTLRVQDSMSNFDTLDVSLHIDFSEVKGDFDGSDYIDLYDLTCLALAWHTGTGQPGYALAADYNNSGYVDLYDLTRFALMWHRKPSEYGMLSLDGPPTSASVLTGIPAAAAGVGLYDEGDGAYSLRWTVPEGATGFEAVISFDPARYQLLQTGGGALCQALGTTAFLVDDSQAAEGLITVTLVKLGRQTAQTGLSGEVALLQFASEGDNGRKRRVGAPAVTGASLTGLEEGEEATPPATNPNRPSERVGREGNKGRLQR